MSVEEFEEKLEGCRKIIRKNLYKASRMDFSDDFVWEWAYLLERLDYMNRRDVEEERKLQNEHQV